MTIRSTSKLTSDAYHIKTSNVQYWPQETVVMKAGGKRWNSVWNKFAR